MAARTFLTTISNVGNEGDGLGEAEPYVISIFFKIDRNVLAWAKGHEGLKDSFVRVQGAHGNAAEINSSDASMRSGFASGLGVFGHVERMVGVDALLGVVSLVLEEDARPTDDQITQLVKNLQPAVTDAIREFLHELENPGLWLAGVLALSFARDEVIKLIEKMLAEAIGKQARSLDTLETDGARQFAGEFAGWMGLALQNAIGDIVAATVDRDDWIGVMVRLWTPAMARQTQYIEWNSEQQGGTEDANFKLTAGYEFLGDHAAFVRLADGVVHGFARGSDNALWHVAFRPGSLVPFALPEKLGGTLTASPAAVSTDGRTIDIFVRGAEPDHQLWTATWNGTLSAWSPLGGELMSAPTACSWSGGRIDVFVVGLDQAIYQLARINGRWEGYFGHGGVCTSDPSVVAWGDNRIDLFVRGTDNTMFQFAFDGRGWTWTRMGGLLTSAPAATSLRPGHLAIFGRGSHGTIEVKVFDGTWRNWESVGEPGPMPPQLINLPPLPGLPSLPLPIPGIPELLGYGPIIDPSVGVTSSPSVVVNDGEMDLYVAARGNLLWHRRSVGGRFDAPWDLLPSEALLLAPHA